MTPILIKTEQAFESVVTSALTTLGYSVGTNVFVRRGIENLDQVAPAVELYAASANEDFPYSGIYRVVFHITVKEMVADTDRNNIGLLSKDVFSSVLVDNIEALLNASVSNYYVYQVRIEDTSDETNSDAWAQKYQLEVVCATTT